MSHRIFICTALWNTAFFYPCSSKRIPFLERRSNPSVSGHVQFCQFSMSQFSHGYNCAFFLRILCFSRADDVLFTLGLLLTQFFSPQFTAKMSVRKKRGQSKTSQVKDYTINPSLIKGLLYNNCKLFKYCYPAFSDYLHCLNTVKKKSK